MEFIKEKLDVPIVREVDVVVAGGGPAGIGAALAAARNGAKTLLIERCASLGGMWTNGLVVWLPIDKVVPFESYKEKKPLQSGIVNEIWDRLVKEGAAYRAEEIYSNPAVARIEIYAQTDPEYVKVITQEMLEEAGVEIMYCSYVTNVIKEDNLVKGVITESKSGRRAILSKVVVDASGDGDVAWYAGAEFDLADSTLKMSHNAVFANVDTSKMNESREWLQMLHGLAAMAEANGELSGPDGELFEAASAVYGKTSIIPMVHLMWYPDNWNRKNEVTGIIANYSGNATDAEVLSKALSTTRKEVLKVFNFYKKYVPGFENSYLSSTSTMLGVRETRRIVGDYVVSLRAPQLKHEDVILRCRTAGVTKASLTPEKAPNFDIPYRSIVPKKIDGLLVAGRCISIDHQLATQLNPRDVVSCICLGQSAGTAAALCVSDNVQPRKLNVKKLQEVLVSQNVNLDH